MTKADYATLRERPMGLCPKPRGLFRPDSAALRERARILEWGFKQGFWTEFSPGLMDGWDGIEVVYW